MGLLGEAEERWFCSPLWEKVERCSWSPLSGLLLLLLLVRLPVIIHNLKKLYQKGLHVVVVSVCILLPMVAYWLQTVEKGCKEQMVVFSCVPTAANCWNRLQSANGYIFLCTNCCKMLKKVTKSKWLYFLACQLLQTVEKGCKEQMVVFSCVPIVANAR